ncbi:AAA domain-containing protein [Kibdelosporangium aridum]|uniref:AAA domain-containing protein n=1 Tax=Kibdelosporangium aridum TaxID=2030 RepID=UPI0035E700B4
MTKLVQYLRDATASARQQTLHLDQYERVTWLSELPEGISVLDEPGQEGRLISIPPVTRPQCPMMPDALADILSIEAWSDAEVDELALREQVVIVEEQQDEEDVWSDPQVNQALADRRRWRELDAQHVPLRTLYEDFRSVAAKLEHNDDEYELVLSAGLIHGTAPGGATVCRHLLTQELSATLNLQSAAVHLTVNRDVRPQLEDRQFLSGVIRSDARLAETIRDDLEVSAPLPHARQSAKLLASWVERMLPDSPPLSNDIRPPTADLPGELTVVMAPAIVFRRRDRTHVVAYFAQMLEVLRAEGRTVPLGLAQLLWTLDQDQRRQWMLETGHDVRDVLGDDPLFPFPTNDEQRRVLARLRIDNTVVVQGPPGTGKTHTTRNLVSALLAQGLRVLVTSQREQPLRVLREGLDDDLQPLCVSLTGGKDGSDLENSIDALSSRLTTSDTAQTEQRVAALTLERKAAKKKVRDLLQRLHAIQDREHQVHTEVSPGYQGSLGDIAKKLITRGNTLGWLGDLPESAPARPPITAPQLVTARRVMRSDSAQQPELFVPPREQIPAAKEFQELIEATTFPDLSPTASGIIGKIANVPASGLSAWRSAVADILDLAHHLRIGHAGLGWPEAAVANILSGRQLDLWRELIRKRGRARDLWAKARHPGARQVWLYVPDRRRLPFLSVQAQILRDGLENRIPLRRWRGLTSFGRQTEEVFRSALVAGRPPLTAEDAQAVLDVLDCEREADELYELWAELGVPLPVGSSLRARLSLLCDSDVLLRQVASLDQKTSAVREKLDLAGIRVVLTTFQQWQALLEAIKYVQAHNAAEPSINRLTTISRYWQQWAAQPHAAAETVAAADAVRSREPSEYREAVASIEILRNEVIERQEARSAWHELETVHPALAARLLAMPDGPEWDHAVGTWDDAWSWAMAAQFVRHIHADDTEAEIETELDAAQQHLLAVTGKLAAEQAWAHCLKRMNQTQSSALRSYQIWARKQGRGGTEYKHEYQRAERDAMAAARGAVPAWIMPIARVAETMPPRQDAFDVVIVDEASQASLGSLFLLWLAPRVIVVGDDKQCTPSGGGNRQYGELFDRLAVDLPDIPLHVRNQYVPDGNLYNILSTRASTVIRLREHFRCMPEIIRWSSRSFYNDQLVPLRQFGANRLDPVVIRDVPDGVMLKGSNEREAEELVSQLARCLDDPAYAGKSFGIITLFGEGQQPTLTRKLNQRVPTDEQLTRKIRIGTSAEFQGDERDVIFLSTVVSGRTKLDRTNAFAQRVNVAVTRAKDQLWLFTSVTVDQLKPEDLRYRLLTELTTGISSQQPVLAARDIPENHNVPPFQSMFTQHVYRAIRQQGFHAEPYVRVGDRMIDILVRGASASVAIICDEYGTQAADERRQFDLQLRELKRAGWPFCRVSHSLFVLDPPRAMAHVWEILRANGIAPVSDHS